MTIVKIRVFGNRPSLARRASRADHGRLYKATEWKKKFYYYKTFHTVSDRLAYLSVHICIELPGTALSLRVVRGGLWHDSRTKKITNQGSRILKFHFLESRK